jgi:transposase
VKYSNDKTDEICKLLETGLRREDAIILADVSETQFYVWLKKAEFAESIKKAELKNKQRSIVIIQNASKQTWQASAWWLERKYPEEFAARQRHELTGKNGGPIATVDFMKLKSARNLTTIAETYEEFYKAVGAKEEKHEK